MWRMPAYKDGCIDIVLSNRVLPCHSGSFQNLAYAPDATIACLICLWGTQLMQCTKFQNILVSCTISQEHTHTSGLQMAHSRCTQSAFLLFESSPMGPIRWPSWSGWKPSARPHRLHDLSSFMVRTGYGSKITKPCDKSRQ